MEEQSSMKDNQTASCCHPVRLQRGFSQLTVRQDKEVHLKILQEMDYRKGQLWRASFPLDCGCQKAGSGGFSLEHPSIQTPGLANSGQVWDIKSWCTCSPVSSLHSMCILASILTFSAQSPVINNLRATSGV